MVGGKGLKLRAPCTAVLENDPPPIDRHRSGRLEQGMDRELGLRHDRRRRHRLRPAPGQSLQNIMTSIMASCCFFLRLDVSVPCILWIDSMDLPIKERDACSLNVVDLEWIIWTRSFKSFRMLRVCTGFQALEERCNNCRSKLPKLQLTKLGSEDYPDPGIYFYNQSQWVRIHI